MLQNPIHLRLEKLESWQHVTFMACLCERMYPNYAAFCKETGFGDGHIYRRILDLIWETLTVKDAKVNFDSSWKSWKRRFRLRMILTCTVSTRRLMRVWRLAILFMLC